MSTPLFDRFLTAWQADDCHHGELAMRVLPVLILLDQVTDIRRPGGVGDWIEQESPLDPDRWLIHWPRIWMHLQGHVGETGQFLLRFAWTIWNGGPAAPLALEEELPGWVEPEFPVDIHELHRGTDVVHLAVLRAIRCHYGHCWGAGMTISPELLGTGAEEELRGVTEAALTWLVDQPWRWVDGS